MTTESEQLKAAREGITYAMDLLIKGDDQSALNILRRTWKVIKPISEKYGCHIDLEENMEPDNCVIDSGDFDDCVHARKGMKKEDCKYWKKIEIT